MGLDFEGVDDEEEQSSSTLKLPLFSSSIALAAATMDSPERPGMRTPPLHTSAAVPFRWEEEPGKPKPCTALITLPSQSDASANKCLELPPRLLLVDPLDHHTTATTSSQTTKVSSSPNTVLEGPYYVGRSCRFQTPFRHMGGECYGSFRKSPSDTETDHDQLGGFVLSRNNSKRLQRDKGVFGSWRRKKKSHYNYKREVGVGGGSYVFPSSVDRYSEYSREEEGTGSFSTATSTTAVSPATPRFWASVYGGLKQVVPWRSKKAKKDGLLGLS